MFVCLYEVHMIAWDVVVAHGSYTFTWNSVDHTFSWITKRMQWAKTFSYFDFSSSRNATKRNSKLNYTNVVEWVELNDWFFLRSSLAVTRFMAFLEKKNVPELVSGFFVRCRYNVNYLIKYKENLKRKSRNCTQISNDWSVDFFTWYKSKCDIMKKHL